MPSPIESFHRSLYPVSPAISPHRGSPPETVVCQFDRNADLQAAAIRAVHRRLLNIFFRFFERIEEFLGFAVCIPTSIDVQFYTRGMLLDNITKYQTSLPSCCPYMTQLVGRGVGM